MRLESIGLWFWIQPSYLFPLPVVLLTVLYLQRPRNLLLAFAIVHMSFMHAKLSVCREHWVGTTVCDPHHCSLSILQRPIGGSWTQGRLISAGQTVALHRGLHCSSAPSESIVLESGRSTSQGLYARSLGEAVSLNPQQHSGSAGACREPVRACLLYHRQCSWPQCCVEHKQLTRHW